VLGAKKSNISAKVSYVCYQNCIGDTGVKVFDVCCRAVSPIYRALLRRYRALLKICRALL